MYLKNPYTDGPQAWERPLARCGLFLRPSRPQTWFWMRIASGMGGPKTLFWMRIVLRPPHLMSGVLAVTAMVGLGAYKKC